MGVMVECGCGTVYEARRVSKYGRCPACAARAKEIRQAQWRERQRAEAASLQEALARHVTYLTVVRDPLGAEGGFRSGVVFSKEDWTQMLRLGAFTNQTVLRDSLGRLYEYQDESWRLT